MFCLLSASDIFCDVYRLFYKDELECELHICRIQCAGHVKLLCKCRMSVWSCFAFISKCLSWDVPMKLSTSKWSFLSYILLSLWVSCILRGNCNIHWCVSNACLCQTTPFWLVFLMVKLVDLCAVYVSFSWSAIIYTSAQEWQHNCWSLDPIKQEWTTPCSHII
jgi:hypothetical protein